MLLVSSLAHTVLAPYHAVILYKRLHLPHKIVFYSCVIQAASQLGEVAYVIVLACFMFVRAYSPLPDSNMSQLSYAVWCMS